MKGLILFDIDKTLVKSSMEYVIAFSKGFREVYDIDSTIDIIDYCGMTDQQIIVEVLKKKGLTESEIDLEIHECMDVILDYFDKIKDSIQVEVLVGVLKLLKELKEQNFIIGLVTGNLEPIGRGKLEKVGLNHYFRFGGFGSDDASRTKLVKLAIKRAGENFGFKFEDNVFLFGDTPRDVDAGNEAGVITIGVATGNYSKRDLENTSADYVVDNLQDTKKILNLVLKKF
ncbi:HAD family hydrolase [Candidatus Pacearchaeota archaeon]|nr:HAD family hydrolase [Candidatus Pacearchaeota archaeon]